MRDRRHPPGEEPLQVIRDCERQGKRVTVLANMIDVLDSHGLSLDTASLAEALHTPVLPVSARSGKGVDAVVREIEASLHGAGNTHDRRLAPDLVQHLGGV